MNYLDILKSNQDIFFNFMRAKYPVYYNSNIFLKDILYAIRSFFEKKNTELSYSAAENLTMEFTGYLENQNDLTRLDANTWKVNFTFENNVKQVAEVL